MSQPADERHVSSELIFRALHDLQAPARHIRSFLSLFRDSIDEATLSSESMETLDAVTRAADELRDRFIAIRSVLSVPTSVGSGVRVDLPFVLQDTWNRLNQNNVDRTTRFTIDGRAEIESDEQLVRDLLWELLDNSLRFRNPEEPLAIQCRLTHSADHIKVEIIDNGLGMDPDRIGWSMQPFHRGRHHDGFGLGLARCVCIAKTIGCELSLRSDGENGTTAELLFRSNCPSA